MRRTAIVFGLTLGLAAACQDREEAPAATLAPEEQTETRDWSEVPSDGSIICPGSIGCPGETGVVARGWSGIIIPKAAVTPHDVVCVAGQTPPEGSPCPSGWTGRLWREPSIAVGTPQEAESGQIVCYPGSPEPACKTVENGESYAFLCYGGKKTYCPGIPRRKKSGDATVANEPSERPPAGTAGTPAAAADN